MAGSYNHCVNKKDGQLLVAEDMAKMIENQGDAFEAIEELFGMIWLLANTIAEETVSDPAEIVEDARRRYKGGLQESPGTNGRLPKEDV